MAEVKTGTKSLLCASSIIEVGVTINELRLLIVVEADRYGVSTLHQFRGRLARRGGEGWCYLYIPKPVEVETLSRLRLLEHTTNGFELAEKDMWARGCGDLDSEGLEQSGASGTVFRGLRLMPSDMSE